MRVAILTSNSLRHNYFVNTIAKHHEVGLVIREKKRDVIETSKKDDVSLMAKHLLERELAEEKYFGAHRDIKTNSLELDPGEVNSDAAYQALDSCAPRVVLLFGTSIVRERILSRFSGSVINMHLGLSPYYRGTATNFWPLVNWEPECVGATLHLATLTVDGGPILHQVRPEVSSTDRSHDIGCKTIIEGTTGMLRILNAWEKGPLRGIPQNLSGGLLYRRRDFSAEAVKKLWNNLNEGMILKYVANLSNRQKARPITELNA